VIVTLLAIALIASWLPARKATQHEVSLKS
jgi:ABC-type lipoprotein release transport system permease subunit